MNWDHLLIKIQNNSFEGLQSEWVPEVTKCILDGMITITKQKIEIMERIYRIVELKVLIGMDLLPDEVIRFMQGNVDQMQTAEIYSFIEEYKSRYGGLKFLHLQNMAEFYLACLFGCHPKNIHQEFSKIDQKHLEKLAKNQNVYERLCAKRLANPASIQYDREHFIGSIKFIKSTEWEISRLAYIYNNYFVLKPLRIS